MDDGSRLSFAIAFILLLLAAWFAAAETALASVSRPSVKAAADRGDLRARNALEVLDHFDRAITAILICTNIVHLSAAAVVTAAVTRIWGLGAVTLSTLLTTLAVFFAGELLPKSIAKKYPNRILLSTAGALRAIMTLLTPFTSVLAAIGAAAGRATKADEELSVTEDELYDIIDDMTEEGSLDEEQGELISSALQFGDVTVESILTPRVDLAAVSVHAAPEEVLSVIRSAAHSRLPVFEGSIDNIIGVLPIRRFLKAYLHGDPCRVKDMLDEVVYVHASTNIDEVLPVLTSRRASLAVVTDNYGGTLGIVTVEDILEELVGEIWDEEDEVEETVTELGEGEFLFPADETVSDMFDTVGFEDPEDDEELVNTLLGEWAYEQFASIPTEGNGFDYHALHVAVEKMDHNRILTLRVKLQNEETEVSADAAEEDKKTEGGAES